VERFLPAEETQKWEVSIKPKNECSFFGFMLPAPLISLSARHETMQVSQKGSHRQLDSIEAGSPPQPTEKEKEDG